MTSKHPKTTRNTIPDVSEWSDGMSKVSVYDIMVGGESRLSPPTWTWMRIRALRPRAYFLVNLGIWKIRPCAYFLEKFRRIWVSVYLRFSFNILVRIYPVKTPFSQNFPAARADRPCAYFFVVEIFTFRKSRCAFIFFKNLLKSGSVRLLGGGG